MNLFGEEDEAVRVRQRADYTHKYNRETGRHGWLRLTPAYSVKVVEELIAGIKSSARVLDPFCGTATTALSAANHGHKAATTDVNPFLVWLGRAKTAHYEEGVIEATRNLGKKVSRKAEKDQPDSFPDPPIYNIERWWSRGSIDYLRNLRGEIDGTTKEGSAERNLLYVAFCRLLIVLSNAAFNHQSMSFKGTDVVSKAPAEMTAEFLQKLAFVLQGAADNPKGDATVVRGDARELSKTLSEKFDVVITSPPYANRMSYIRELRPYMYWLGYLKVAKEAGDLDWESIGGTWGIATSRLLTWKSTNGHHSPRELIEATEQIAHAGNANGKVLSLYVNKYFDDMYAHFESLTNVLKRGAVVHYIVGNSTFYGVMVAVERIYEHFLRKLGFKDVSSRIIRKRNSKKELLEFDVSGVWP